MLLIANAAAHAETHEYYVTVSDDMQRLSVEAHFVEPVTSIRARSSDAYRFLVDPRRCDTNERIRVRSGRMQIPTEGIDCIRYDVDLQRAARSERRNQVLAESNIVVSPADWFWRPSLRGNNDIAVHFDMSDSMYVFVPWQVMPGHDNAFVLSDSPESSAAPAVFGKFQYAEREIAGATLRITLLQPEGDIDTDNLFDWVASAANNVTLAYGRFPNPSPSVLVLPVGDGWDPDASVHFGRVIRDGGETVELMINENRPVAEYYDNWTATHEFSHLMLPYIRRPHRWVSEGFASYYQNMLLARAGHYSEQRAWQKLWEGLERGRQSRPDLSPNEAGRGGIRTALMKVYWSGASIALMADVELRERSGGTESLDTVLEKLQACCLPADRKWTGTELFEKLDTFVDEPVFMPLYRRYANSDGFPDARPLLARLGVDVSGRRVRFDDAAELADIRKALTTAP
ncbi:MAG: hypothetical protein R3358_08790 [Woeseiaceae bacterium]|nr:hypothetical protein [Woeseiaceae bacterium]